MHLYYSCMTAGVNGEKRHPQIVMSALGINYSHATPQSMFDSWWFWNCQNIPEPLPKYLRELMIDPMQQIGNGLSLKDAAEIVEQSNQ